MTRITYSCEKIVKLLQRGIFAIDKIKNHTSSENLEIIKIVLKKDIHPECRPSKLRLGHGGTLDSTATGVLVVGVGYGCKVLPQLLKGDKKYIVTGCLGTATDTYNETGSITNQLPYGHVTKESLEHQLLQYMGNIMQTPPKYSALKRCGRRLSDLVRDGHDITVNPRPVVCHLIECLDFSPPDFILSVTCGGGFYVRSLVHNIGQDLHTCAYVKSLRRIQHGDFYESDAVPYSDWNAQTFLDALNANTHRTRRYHKKDIW